MQGCVRVAVGRIVGHLGWHRGPVPAGAGPAAARQPRARADAVSHLGPAPGARRGRAHAAAHAQPAAHARARAHAAAARHHAHEGTPALASHLATSSRISHISHAHAARYPCS